MNKKWRSWKKLTDIWRRLRKQSASISISICKLRNQTLNQFWTPAAQDRDRFGDLLEHFTNRKWRSWSQPDEHSETIREEECAKFGSDSQTQIAKSKSHLNIQPIIPETKSDIFANNLWMKSDGARWKMNAHPMTIKKRNLAGIQN